MALATVFKVYNSVAKGLKIKVRESYRKETGRETFWTPPSDIGLICIYSKIKLTIHLLKPIGVSG